jgi:hypothetical protein
VEAETPAAQPTPELPPISFRLPPEEHDAFRRACANVERSMSGQMRLLVRDWLRGRGELPDQVAA